MVRLSGWLAVLVLCLLPASAIASPDALGRCVFPPGYYRVAKTADAGDLHLRSDPRLEANRIGQLQRSDIVFSSGGRIISDDVTWQSVNVLQSEAWIPARSLWRALPLTTDETAIPVAGRCGDYQPLWSVSWSGRDFRLSLFPGRHLMNGVNIQDGMKQGTVLVNGATAGATMSFVYSDEVCTDPQGKVLGQGRGSLIVRDGSSERLFTGCCETSTEAFTKR